MTAKLLNIVVERGVDFRLVIPLPSSINLVNAQAAMQFRVEIDDPTALLTLTTLNGGLAIDPQARTLAISFDARTAAAFYAGNYVHDIKVQESDGTKVAPYRGQASVIGEVTLFDFNIDVPGALLLRSGGYIRLKNGGRILLKQGPSDFAGFAMDYSNTNNSGYLGGL